MDTPKPSFQMKMAVCGWFVWLMLWWGLIAFASSNPVVSAVMATFVRYTVYGTGLFLTIRVLATLDTEPGNPPVPITQGESRAFLVFLAYLLPSGAISMAYLGWNAVFPWL